MKRFKTLSLLMAVGMLSVGVVACKGKKEAGPAAGEVFVDVPCSGPDYFTDKKFFRANAIGESLDQMTAKKNILFVMLMKGILEHLWTGQFSKEIPIQ